MFGFLSSYSQLNGLYHLDNSVSTEKFDYYLLLYPSGNFFIISDYYYGESNEQFYSDKYPPSSTLPYQIILSYGLYQLNGDSLILHDFVFGLKQYFRIDKNRIVGEDCFEYLKNKFLFRIDTISISPEVFIYNGGALNENYLLEILSSNKASNLPDIIQKNQYVKPNSISILHKNKQDRYRHEFGLIEIIFKEDKFLYKIGHLVILKGTYKQHGSIVDLVSSCCGQYAFKMKYINDRLYSDELPLTSKGERFYLMKNNE